MKRLLLYMLVIAALFCGCAKPAGEPMARTLALEEGYERRTEKMPLSDFSGGITAAHLHDGRLWFVCENALYSAELDGSDVQEVFGSLPDNVQYIAFGLVGEIYLGTPDGVHIFSAGGELLSRASLEITSQIQSLMDLTVLPDGAIAALVWTDHNGILARVLSGGEFGDEIDISLPENTDVRGLTYYDGALLLSIADGLFEYSEEALLPVFRWADIGVVNSYNQIAGITATEEIIYLDRAEGSLHIIKSRAVTSEKTELTLAFVSEIGMVPDAAAKAVAAFNGSNSEYKIKIVAISSTEQLSLQITAGDIPDLIQVDFPFPFDNYAAKGIFEDLSPYFENDPEVALVPDIRRILSTGDKLFRAAPGFMAMTLTGVSDFVGEENGWTFEEMKQYLSNAPEGASVFPHVWNEESVLTFALYQNIDGFIDWETGMALFDTPDFRELLELAEMYPKPEPEVPRELVLLEGMELISHGAFWSLDSFSATDNFVGGKAVHKGFPSSARSSGILYTAGLTVAMTSACDYKDAAWSFVRMMLLEDENFQTIPTVQSKFDLAVETAMTPGRVSVSPFERFDIEPMTQEQYGEFMHLLDGITLVQSGNLAVRKIIEEEVAPYFAGQRSVEETCRIIQSRAQIYVSEQSR